MGSYSLNQWLLLFYLYCFIGWVWESCYVSFEEKKWVNRGFLRGPFLPIYGFGATIILIATLPVRKNLFLVFVFGMVAATILEYVTGVIMEKIFHVRYWDYSDEAFNLNGHICLLCSLAWGGFSILMVKVIHPPINIIIMNMPETIIELITFILTIIITIDIVQSFYAAMDLKQLLYKYTENSESIKYIKKRFDVIAAFLNEDVKEFEIKIKDKVELSLEKKDLIKKSSLNKKDALYRSIQNTKNKKLQALQGLYEKVTYYLEKLESTSDKSSQQYNKFKTEFYEYLIKIKKEKNFFENTEDRRYKNSMSILRRNPKAKTKKYSEAMKEIKNFFNEK